MSSFDHGVPNLGCEPVLELARGTSLEMLGDFSPFGFREASGNLLTTDTLDPVGKIPSFKYAAVRVEPA